MNDPDEKQLNEQGRAESPSGSDDKPDDTGTTLRLKTLKLEGELWPDEDASDPDEDNGVDPYNTGRFERKKR